MKYVEAIAGHRIYKKREHPEYEWGESLTSQEFKDECDTEKILERYSNAGLPLPAVTVEGMYRDCTDMRNLQQHLNATREFLDNAQRGFETMPLKLRKRFDHDVVKMVEWLEDPENLEESYQLGLREKKQGVMDVGGASPAAQTPIKEEEKKTKD